ncbi:hypothetical protein BHM03_00005126 [Ensete ventricosum]|nr:hypothetical protein BHM03_00005126 [Ensete ventricosum]
MAKEAATLSLNDGRSCTRKQWRWRELRMEDCLDAYGNLALPRPPLLRLHRLCSRESSCPTSPLVPRRMIRGRREGGARQGQEDVSMFGASTTTSPCPVTSFCICINADTDAEHRKGHLITAYLPSGLTGYVTVNEDGILTIGVGWYSDEGINLVMDRDHGMDGKLKDARCKFEVQKRWTDSYLVIC